MQNLKEIIESLTTQALNADAQGNTEKVLDIFKRVELLHSKTLAEETKTQLELN